MTTKLTLTIDDAIVDQAKQYARRKKMSLSKLVEFYFSSLTTSSSVQEKEPLPPITAELSGLVKNVTIDDEKGILEEALTEKYL